MTKSINRINRASLSIECLKDELYPKALLFLESIFTKEQGIPKEMIPLSNEKQNWWCIRHEDEIVGIVVAYEENSEWHMGRFAIDEKLRGLGLGTDLLKKAATELFKKEAQIIIIDARDVAVKIIQKLGGKITGETQYFYNSPITPTVINKQDFEKATS